MTLTVILQLFIRRFELKLHGKILQLNSINTPNNNFMKENKLTNWTLELYDKYMRWDQIIE
jgi:hypothetical protein